MATADEYAAWIVANRARKGTPEFDTVAKAYEEAKAAPAMDTPSPAPAQSASQRITGAAAKGFTEAKGLGKLPAALMSGLGEAASVAGESLDKAAYSAGGKVTDVASRMGLPAEAAAGAGLAANVGVQAAPMVLGGELGKLASPAMVSGAKSVMQSALKPTLNALQTGKAAKAIDTLLEEGINVSQGGVMKLRTAITDLNSQVQAAIANSTGVVNKKEIAKTIGETLNKFKYQATPAADKNAILAAWNEFKNTWFASGSDLPVQVAQKVKQGTQRAVSKSYGQLSDASIEAQKDIARWLREGISKAVPEVSALNARESSLINALNVTERRTLMELNKNPAGLALLAHNPASFVAFMADKSGAFKSIVARMMYSGAEQIPASAGRATVGLGMGAMSDQNP